MTGYRAAWTAALLAAQSTLVLPALVLAPGGPTERSPDALLMDLRLAETPPGVVVLGNSIANAAIDEEQLSAELGTPVVALTVAHSEAPTWYAVLKYRVIAAGHRPRLVLVPTALANLLGLGLGTTADDVRLRDHVDAPDPILERKVFGRSGDERLARLHAARERARRLLVWAGPGLALALPSGKPWRAGMERTERALDRVFDEEAMRVPTALDDGPLDIQARLPPLDEGMVGDLVDLAQEHGMTVVFVRPPQAPGNLVGEPVSIERQRELVTTLNQRGAGYLDLRELPVRASDFQDPFHLDESGRQRVTRRIAAAIREWGLPEGARPPPAPLPPRPPTVAREGRAPPIASEASALPDGRVALSSPVLEVLDDARLAAVGLGGAAPIEVLSGEDALTRAGPADPCCAPGTWRQVGTAIEVWPTRRWFAPPLSLRVAAATETRGDIGHPVRWVPPGTALRYTLADPVETAVPIALSVQPFGGGAGVARVDEHPLTSVGGRATARWTLAPGAAGFTISSPADGPWLAVVSLVVGEGPRRAELVPGGGAPVVHLVGREQDQTSAVWRGDPPPVPEGLRVPVVVPAPRGTGRVVQPALAHLADNQTGKCSPIVVLEDGVPLPHRHTGCFDVERRRGSMCHTLNTLLFSTTDGSDPTTNGRRYTLGLSREMGRYCHTEQWLFPGDGLRVEAPPHALVAFERGPNTLSLAGQTVSARDDLGGARLHVVLVADGRVLADAQVPHLALDADAAVLPLVGLSPTTAQVVLTIENPADGPFLLLRTASLLELDPERAPVPGSGPPR